MVKLSKNKFSVSLGWRKVMSCESGFTLLELIIAITIMVIVAVFLVPLFSISSDGIIQSGNLSRGQYTSQQSFENAMAAGGTGVSDSITIRFSGISQDIIVHGKTEQSGSWRVFIPNELGITVPNGGMPSGASGHSYTTVFIATGGTQPYKFTLSQGSLPNGLTLNRNTGEVSGTPTDAETSTFTVQVTDSSTPQMLRTRVFSIVINSTFAAQINK